MAMLSPSLPLSLSLSTASRPFASGGAHSSKRTVGHAHFPCAMMAWPEHSATHGLARGMSARRFACPYVLESGRLTRGRLSNAADSCDGTRSTLQTAGLAPICYIQVVIPTFRHDASVLQHAPVLHIRSWFLVFRESVAMAARRGRRLRPRSCVQQKPCSLQDTAVHLS